MAASQATLELRNNSDANFRLWGEFISDGLLAGGWTLEDTDIDWSTVSAPAQNTYAGYEIWKSPDEAGLTNFYLKLRYGSSNNAAPAAQLEWQVGWEYSGSGSSLGGTPTTVLNTVTADAGSSTLIPCSIAAGAGYLALAMADAFNTTATRVLVIERTRGTDLLPQNELAIMHSHYQSGLQFNNRVYTENSLEYISTTQSSAAQSWFINESNAPATNNISRGRVPLFMAIPRRWNRTSPVSGWLGHPNSSLGPGNELIEITVYGENRTYRILDSNSGTGTWGISGTDSLIRCD